MDSLSDHAEEDSVLIRLSVMQPGNIEHPERRILLTRSEPTAQLGRSSSRPSLRLQPAITNGWYNSPVMSRHHALLEADFTNETVGISDSGSMHGTFLNKNNVAGNMSRIRVGDELTLGVPVFRNREEFQPALMRVDGVEFNEASRQPTTTPTRTFTVPDDCSTDDNEPVDESFDEPTVIAPVGSPNPSNPWAISNPPPVGVPSSTWESHVDTSHQLDGADDHSTPGDALPQSAYMPVGVFSDVSSCDGSLICNDSHNEQDNLSLHDMDSDHDLGIQNVDLGDESRSPSWNSFSSDSEDEHIDDESALDDSASEGFALFEDDSDEDPLDETDVDDTVQPGGDFDDFEQHSVHGPQVPSAETATTCAPILPVPLQRLPPISDVIQAGLNDWMSRSHSNWGPRSPSPSDAVLLPRHCRTDTAVGEKPQGDMRLDAADQTVLDDMEVVVDDMQGNAKNLVHKPKVVEPTMLGGGSISNQAIVAEVASSDLVTDDVDDGMEVDENVSKGFADFDKLTYLPRDSEKAEFFAARAVNKKAHDANMQSERPSENVSTMPKQGKLSVFHCDEREAEINMPLTNTHEVADCFVFAPHARGLTGQGMSSGIVHQPDSAGTQRRALNEPNFPFSHEAAVWSFDQGYDVPSSAYEFQCLKEHAQAETPLRGPSWAARNLNSREHYEPMEHPRQAPKNVDAVASPHIELSAISDTLTKRFEQLSQELDEQEASLLSTGKHDARKGKRKAADISEEDMPAMARTHSAFSGSQDKTTFSSETVQSSSHSASRSPLPSPPPSPAEVGGVEQRPTKRMKRIAECVGYAALGGVSVGAMVLTSLIYTAPSFV